jgi:hypothetical protein
MGELAKLLVAALVGAVITIAVGYFGYASKNEALHVRFVELAIGILRTDPKEGTAPAREWAINVIEKNSGVNFSAEDRAALLSKPILSKGIWLGKDLSDDPDVGEFWAQMFKSGQTSKNQQNSGYSCATHVV